MKNEGDSFYQLTEYKNRTKQKPPERFDIVIGSGLRGQTYATWNDDRLFQLQTSYYSPTDRWVNSPGFPSFGVDRPIRDACLKCHTTFAKNRDFSGSGNQYDKERIIFGIECERCHRPSAQHVTYHRKNPEVEAAHFMMKFDTLARQQRLDVCAQCHSGPRDQLLKGNSFSFLAGENLNEFAQNAYVPNQSNNLDVHGNQYGLLTNSKCFKKSATMDCMTCHDPHKNQRGNLNHFNQKCMACHTAGANVCQADRSEKDSKANNCIACHMPVKPSEIMKVQLNENDSLQTSFYIRSHLIGVYQKDSLVSRLK